MAAENAEVKARIVRQIEMLQAEKQSRSKAQKKLASALLDVIHMHRMGVVSSEVPTLEAQMKPGADGMVTVDLSGQASAEMLGAIRTRGGAVLRTGAKGRSVRARVPVDTLEALAELPEITAIRPAAEATTNVETVFSEGDAAHRADLARNSYGVTGAGVKIGVLSDSVDHLSRSQAGGELQSVQVLPGQGGFGTHSEGEGTAMLEIVHDLAPGAELCFATAFLSAESFAENIRDLAAAGCSILIDDVNYFDESPFQDGVIAQAVNDVSAQGVLYFSSARNAGNQSDGTSGTWEGDFVDGGSAGRRGRFLDFGGGRIGNRVKSSGSERRVDFFWADPLGAATNDYDLFVVDAQGFVVARSNDLQDGSQDPYESVRSLHSGERIVVVKASGEDRFLHLDIGRGRLAISTAGAVRGHSASDAANAFSVAATSAFRRRVPFSGGANNPVERFSSDGFRRIFYEADGTPITPGDFSSTGGRVLLKPDLTAADGVVTSVPGFRTFFGTSAAAPHAGAIAALLLSFKPTLTPAQVREALQATALDIEAKGFDADSGAGIIDAQAALDFVAGLPNEIPSIVASASTVKFRENDAPVIIDPEITVTDLDSVDLNGGTFSARVVQGADPLDSLAVAAEGFAPGMIGISGNQVTFGGVVFGTFTPGPAVAVALSTSAATPAAVQALARRITFFNSSENPTSGPRQIEFSVSDGDGGTSAPTTRTVDVLSINDPPTFTIGPDQILRNDSASISIPNWATNIRAGPEAEVAQILGFLVQTSDSGLFQIPPAISIDGMLTFQAAQNATGTAVVDVILRDDGGTADGGIDTSASATVPHFY